MAAVVAAAAAAGARHSVGCIMTAIAAAPHLLLAGPLHVQPACESTWHLLQTVPTPNNWAR